MMEGPVAVVACQASAQATEQHDCGYKTACNIHPMMATLNSRFYDFLHRISIEELTRAPIQDAHTARIVPAIAAVAYAGAGEEP